MQQGTAMKLKTCNEMGGATLQVASCNKMLMRAATVVQVLQTCCMFYCSYDTGLCVTNFLFFCDHVC